jgi:hypothetical protein
MVQMLEHLLCKGKTLSSNPNSVKKINKQENTFSAIFNFWTLILKKRQAEQYYLHLTEKTVPAALWILNVPKSCVKGFVPRVADALRDGA